MRCSGEGRRGVRGVVVSGQGVRGVVVRERGEGEV